MAGTGVFGYTGDGGLATLARLGIPTNIDFDISGNSYIAVYNSHVIRMISKITGIITTVAGTGLAGYSGDGGLATLAQLKSPFDIAFDESENMYIADYGNYVIRKVTKSTGIITTVAGIAGE